MTSFVTNNIPAEQNNNCDINECTKLQNFIDLQSKLITQEEAYGQRAEEIGRQFPGLNKLFRYVEMFPEQMTAKIARDSNDSTSNSFGAAPGSLSISADLIMPGINGLRVGELFWVDRIPAFYRAFGAFQIMSIEDIVDMEGWKTKVHARFNYLGKEWRQSVLELFKKRETANATPNNQ